MIFLHQFFVHICDTVNTNLNPAVDITVRDVLRRLVQFSDPLVLQLRASRLFCHFIQHTLNIRRRPVVLLPFVSVVAFGHSSDRLGNGIGLNKRDSAAFSRSCFLFPGFATSAVSVLRFRCSGCRFTRLVFPSRVASGSAAASIRFFRLCILFLVRRGFSSGTLAFSRGRICSRTF